MNTACVIRRSVKALLPRHYYSMLFCVVFEICQGGTVPKEYYIAEADDSHMETTTIDKGDCLKIEVEVDVPGSLIRYGA